MKIENIPRAVALIATVIGAAVNLGFFIRSWGSVNLAGVGLALWVLSPWIILAATLRLHWDKPACATVLGLLSIIILLLSARKYYQILVAHYDAQAELIFIVLPGMALPLPLLLLIIGYWISDRYLGTDS